MAWSDEELQTAKLIHGPTENLSDTYRLRIEGKGWIDVPGWMVGDQKAAKLRMRAADVIRERILKNGEKPQIGGT